MCGQPVDSLPLNRSIFTGSWIGIAIGLLIIVGIVVGLNRYQQGSNASARTSQNVPPIATDTATITPTPGPTNTPTVTPTQTPLPTPTPRTHIIEPGENPSYIADLYGVTVDQLIALNKIEDVRALAVGQALLIPPSSSGDSSLDPQALPPQIVYIVESGDTLLDIALNHGTTIEAITIANPNLNLDLIYPGQELVVPLATPTPTSTPTSTLTPTPTPGPPHAPPDLLAPIDGQRLEAETILFNWTATGLLADEEFYVLQIGWADGSQTEYWTTSNAWRVSKKERPAAGPLTWAVTIMRQTHTGDDGQPIGHSLTEPNPPRTVEWP
jgi:LysM repeat protein